MLKIKFRILVLSVLVLFIVVLSRHYYNSKNVFYVQENICSNYLSSSKDSAKSEYLNYICSKTGLSPGVVSKYIKNGNVEFIKYMFSIYNKIPEYETKYIFYPFTATEKNISKKTPLPDLKKGDILITFNTHTLDWRHGHCAIVIDDIKMKTIEHASIGNVSVISDAYEWGRYPSFAVLRYPDAFIAEKAAKYAEKHLHGIDYSIFAGIFGKKYNTQKSNCSHIVWMAFYSAGVDVDGDGGKIVTPKDILSCTALKAVQLFGINDSEFKTRWLMP